MKSSVTSAIAILIAATFSNPVHAADATASMELGFLPAATDVTLLNEGGKFVTVDMKKIAKGDKCHLDKDAPIVKVGPGATAGTILVRFAAPQFNHGGCPFMTEFELSDADYTAAHAAFTAKADEASKKFDDLKKQLGDKWNELTTPKQ